MAALVGCCAPLLLTTLPPAWVWLVLAGLPLAGLLARRMVWALLLVLIAVGFGAQLALRAQGTLSDRLSGQDTVQDVTVTVVLQGLPSRSEGAYSAWMMEGVMRDGPRPGAKLRLSWAHPPQPIGPGQVWTLPVRLKNFSGTRNFHGFDPETWAFSQGIVLQGSVKSGRRDPPAQRLEDDQGLLSRIDRLRFAARQLIESTLAERPHWGVISGLVVGDQAVISADHWRLFAQTGISHLVSISGLHVTLFAWAAREAARLVWRVLSRPPIRLALWLPFPPVGAVTAALAALGYALLAGFNLPAQRTAVMVCTAAMATLAGRQLSSWDVLGITLLVMLALEPTAPLSPGFWLSFFAVGLLFAQPEGQGRWLRSAARAQWAMTIGLAPLTVAFFHQISVVGPLANAVAIPWVTYCVTPLALLGTPLAALGWTGPLVLAERCFGWLVDLIEPMAGWSWSVAAWHAPPLWACVVACLGVAWALQPQHPAISPRQRHAGWLLLPVLLVGGQPAPQRGEWSLTALDIGQGTAVVVRTQHHTLLYDTGPSMGSSNAARRIVLPQMQAEGLGPLNLLMVSHDDDDHASGLQEVLTAQTEAVLVTSLQPHELSARGLAAAQVQGAVRCEWGVGWTWDGVQFRVLYPYPDRVLAEKSANDDSCVLEVTDASGRRVILAGDLSSKAEADWLSQQPWLSSKTSPLVFMTPHHGSRDSTSEESLRLLRPDWAFSQSKYQGRFLHPHPEVVERLRAQGIPFLRTDLQGAIRLAWQGDGLAVETAQDHRRFWHLPR
jgi:competence protein ComEC